MKTIPCRLVTIIAEDELEQKLITDLKRLGVTGYTVFDVRGEGAHGVRGSRWEGENVQIETLVGEETAERILEHVASTYFEKFAVVVYVTGADVIRGSKYTGGGRAGVKKP
jgi:nitrogen regulatory protein P-II 2